MRLYELAKKHEVDGKSLLTIVQAAGFAVKSTLVSVGDDVVAWVAEEAAKGLSVPVAPTKKKKAAKSKAPTKVKSTAARPAPAVKKKRPLRPKADAAAAAATPDESSAAQAATETAPATKSKTKIKSTSKAKKKETVVAAVEAPTAEADDATDDKPTKAKKRKKAVKAKTPGKEKKRGKGKRSATDEDADEVPMPSAKPAPEEIAEDAPAPKKVSAPKPAAPPAAPKEIATAEDIAATDVILVTAEEETEKVHTGQKHKRADFRARKRDHALPAEFASLDSELTRTMTGGSRRRRPPGGRRPRMRRGRGRRRAQTVVRERDPNAVVPVMPGMTVRDLSIALGVKLNAILGSLMKAGEMIQANDNLNEETILQIAEENNIKTAWKGEMDLEEELEAMIADRHTAREDEEATPRAPVITFMGHVDHGKTSLLDKIRQTRVTAGESGGITQHIGAYSIEKNDHPITFLDTPGHEAFTNLRARGAQLTDIAVLIVAADDGVMPQTEEACSHARNAGVPIVVAINKCDLPNANPDRVRQELSTRLELLPEEWGGQVGMVNVSAETGEGIEELLERILLEAEVLELTAHPDRLATGHVIESRITENRGVVASVLIMDGTLERGDVILSSHGYGKVKLMFDENGTTIDAVGPAYAAEITGLNNVPEAGEKIYVLDSISKARDIAEKREHEARVRQLSVRSHVTLENLTAHLALAEMRQLNVIIKADVNGSLEVLQKTLGDLATDEVRINIIHAAVGGINQADVILADAADAIIVGFHVLADQNARLQSQSHGVQIKIYHIIYRLIEDMKAALEGLLPPEEREVVQGQVEIREVFKSSKLGNIAGCYVTSGVITRNSQVRLFRDEVMLFDGKIGTLRRFKDDAREVREGFECGLVVQGFDRIQAGDTLQAYIIEEHARKLE